MLFCQLRIISGVTDEVFRHKAIDTLSSRVTLGFGLLQIEQLAWKLPSSWLSVIVSAGYELIIAFVP